MKRALITGSSRGVGAETAKLLAQHEFEVALNFREKAARAQRVANAISERGGSAFPVQADISDAKAVEEMFDLLESRWGHLDLLILNASGGMEINAAEDYAMRLNRDAQLAVTQAALPLMTEGGRIVFVTSNQAHFGVGSVSEYAPIAASKKAGEEALLRLAPEMNARGVSLVIVTGDIIRNSATAMLLERKHTGLLDQREKELGELLTVETFAMGIVNAAMAEPPSADPVVVGPRP